MSEMNNPMAEAISAIEGRVQVAPSKIPENSTLVGIRLDRDETVSGRFTTAIDQQSWMAYGWAVAVKDGHTVASNPIFGRFTKGRLKVTACHWCHCSACGRRAPMPALVWEAKDYARERDGIEYSQDTPGMVILENHGRCPCGGKWKVDAAFEKEELMKLSEAVMKTYSEQSTVTKLLPPTGFSVGVAGEIPPEWEWLKSAMARQGKAISLLRKESPGGVILYNPGYWIGWVNNPDDTGLFWVEEGSAKKKRCYFNPHGVEGL